MGKEFKKSFMHKTRRRLVDMVNTGEYEHDTVVGYKKSDIQREIGDIWEDENTRYEKKEGYTLKTSKNTEALKEVRDYIAQQYTCNNIECKRSKKNEKDKILIQRTGFCIDCLAEKETEIRIAGIWEEYQNYRIWTRMLIHGKIKLEQILQAHDEAKQVYEYINEDGTTEKWTMPQDVEEVKSEMMDLYNSGVEEIKELEAKRLIAFNTIQEHGYEHYI